MSKNTSQSVLLKFLLHLHPPRIPADSAKFTYTFGLGGLTLFAFFVTLISGIVLLFLYSPTPETAHQSLQQIATVTPYGWYLRNLHFWAAQVMVIAAVLHMLRVVLTGGYLNGRAFNWVIGVILLIFVFLMDFTGFPLRWDAESHWALVVGTNLLKTIPMVGQGADLISDTIPCSGFTAGIFSVCRLLLPCLLSIMSIESEKTVESPGSLIPGGQKLSHGRHSLARKHSSCCSPAAD
jgi:quinol-cytochrome oxidoreductase complex cytochrome b subunit